MCWFNLPKCTLNDGVSKDIDHLTSEVYEVVKPWAHRGGSHRICVELMDVIHMAETVIRDMGMNTDQIEKAYTEVLEKNKKRGYYG